MAVWPISLSVKRISWNVFTSSSCTVCNKNVMQSVLYVSGSTETLIYLFLYKVGVVSSACTRAFFWWNSPRHSECLVVYPTCSRLVSSPDCKLTSVWWGGLLTAVQRRTKSAHIGDVVLTLGVWFPIQDYAWKSRRCQVLTLVHWQNYIESTIGPDNADVRSELADVTG